MGKDKLAKYTAAAKSNVRGVIKRGQAHDVSHSSRPTKITAVSRKVMEGIVDNNGRLPLRDTTKKANESIAKNTRL